VESVSIREQSAEQQRDRKTYRVSVLLSANLSFALVDAAKPSIVVNDLFKAEAQCLVFNDPQRKRSGIKLERLDFMFWGGPEIGGTRKPFLLSFARVLNTGLRRTYFPYGESPQVECTSLEQLTTTLAAFVKRAFLWLKSQGSAMRSWAGILMWHTI